MDVPLNALGYLEKPYKLCKAGSGAITFKVTSYRATPHLYLLNKECPHEALFRIILYDDMVLLSDLKSSEQNITFAIPEPYTQNTREFWLTWYNDVIRMGKINEPKGFLQYLDVNENKQVIGYIKFQTSNNGSGIVEWNFEPPPITNTLPEPPKPVSSGKLRWVQMRTGDLLPIDAMIAGFENEPLYIARAHHRGSLCPGKYVKSKQEAFIAWGSREFPKNEFEVLCGYDASWVKCFDNLIPENAFIGGTSEVHNEPLFIGRARIQNDVIPGKVHMLYKTCYLPYQGREVDKGVYEILVTNKPLRGETCHSQCYMKMNMQPCIGLPMHPD